MAQVHFILAKLDLKLKINLSKRLLFFLIRGGIKFWKESPLKRQTFHLRWNEKTLLFALIHLSINFISACSSPRSNQILEKHQF